MKRAEWVISELGLESLMLAGLSIGWLKAWVLAAGASEVAVRLPGGDQQSSVDWQIFLASREELAAVAQGHGAEVRIALVNPDRDCLHYRADGCRVLLLPLGDVAYQRGAWLAALNGGEALRPLYVAADASLPLALEAGLYGSFHPPAGASILSAEGLLPEEQVIAQLKQQGLSVRTVESCTAGSIIARLCRLPGASDVVDRAWVTYTNQAKQDEVGVDAAVLEQDGAVSQAVVCSMAEGGADDSHLCIAVSGIAGPGGGSPEKPVGTIWIAVARQGSATVTRCLHLSGSRSEIQARTVVAALCLLLEYLSKN